MALDGLFESDGAAMDTSADLFFGERGEEAFDLVDPERAGWGEVQSEPRMAQQPAMDERRLVGAGVVDHEVHVELRRHLPITVPVAMSSAAKSDVVP